MLVQTSNAQNKSFLPVETCFLCLRVLKNAQGLLRDIRIQKLWIHTQITIFVWFAGSNYAYKYTYHKKNCPTNRNKQKKCTPQPQSFKTMLWNNLLYFEHSWGGALSVFTNKETFFPVIIHFSHARATLHCSKWIISGLSITFRDFYTKRAAGGHANLCTLSMSWSAS